MAWNPFKLFRKNFLGVDIGTSSIKIVELSKKREKYKLENYGEVKTTALYKKSFRTFKEHILLLSTKDIATGIKAIIEEAKIKTKDVNFTIPDFSSFFTSFDLPPMAAKELAQAVRYEAHRHIPLPLTEVVLDWTIIEGEANNKKDKKKLKILSVAIPKGVVEQYQQIATLSELKLRALEAEVFALSRAAVREKERVIGLVDIGAQSSTVSIIEKGILKTSHSFDASANELTEVVARVLNIDYQKAEELKKKQGLLSVGGEIEEKEEIREILSPVIDLILQELNKITEDFYRIEGKELDKIVLAGGSAFLPGLKDYFYDKVKKEIEIADPFKEVSYPPILEKTLKEMSPGYAIAVGAAMRALM